MPPMMGESMYIIEPKGITLGSAATCPGATWIPLLVIPVTQ